MCTYQTKELGNKWNEIERDMQNHSYRWELPTSPFQQLVEPSNRSAKTQRYWQHNQQDVIDVYRTTTECTFVMQSWGIHQGKPYLVLWNDFNKFTVVYTILSRSSDCNKIEPEINNRSTIGESQNMYKLKNILLNNRTKVSKEIKKIYMNWT